MKNYPDTNQISDEDAKHQFGHGGLLRKINLHQLLSRFFVGHGLNKLTTRRRVMALVILALVILGGYIVYQRYFHLTPAEKAQKELAAAVAAVSKHIILPEGDQPVLATVTDAKTLIAQQAFFAGAVNGDELLLFPRSLKAVLYSPSRNIIVNTGPIQQSQTVPAGATAQSNAQVIPTTPSASSAIPNTLLVEIRNGTGKTGYASTVADQLRNNAGYSITKVTDANKKDYKKTVVFSEVKNDAQKQAVNALAAALNGSTVPSLPAGEKSTDADILVILGGNE